MTSPPPLLFDTYYHIDNRGNNREDIFIQERNYYHFLNLYGKYIEPIAETFAYCLLKNHFHCLVRIKSENEIIETLKTLKVSPANSRSAMHRSLPSQQPGQTTKPLGSLYPSRQFSNLFNAYAKAINAAYGRTGSLFQHPFGRVMVTNTSQFFQVIIYIHQNPQKHGFVDDFREWKYSSYDTLLSEKPTQLKRDQVFEWVGGKQQYIDLHSEWISEQQSKAFANTDNE